MENLSALIAGKPGQGKSTAIENAVFDEIEKRDRTIFVIDPHGETTHRIADCIPRRLIKKTVYIDPAEEHVVGFNPLTTTVEHQIANYKAIWKNSIEDSWGPQLEYLLRFALLVLYGKSRLNAPRPCPALPRPRTPRNHAS